MPGSSHAEFFSDAKKIPLDKLTNQGFLGFCPKIFFFFLVQDFFLAVRKMFLLQGKKSCEMKKKTVLSLYHEEFSWRQKKKYCEFAVASFCSLTKSILNTRTEKFNIANLQLENLSVSLTPKLS